MSDTATASKFHQHVFIITKLDPRAGRSWQGRHLQHSDDAVHRCVLDGMYAVVRRVPQRVDICVLFVVRYTTILNTFGMCVTMWLLRRVHESRFEKQL